jgi:hypothetical protein
MHVIATRKGNVGGKTFTGRLIDTTTPFVALPSIRAFNKVVRVTNLANSKSILASVLDAGPTNQNDDNYVFDGFQPLAASGIDLGEFVWGSLGMTGTGLVDWEFVVNPAALLTVGITGTASEDTAALVRKSGH